MLSGIDLNYIKTVNWYRQGGAGVPFYFIVPFYSGMKLWGKKNLIVHQDGVMHRGYFNSLAELKAGNADIVKQSRDRRYIDSKITTWENCINERNSLVKYIELRDLSKLSLSHLLNLYKKFVNADYQSWVISVHIEAFDPWGDKIINDVINKYNLTIKPDDLVLITTPKEMTLTQQEELGLLNVRMSPVNKRGTLLQFHQQKYFWLQRDWAHATTLKLDYFTKNFEKLLKIHLSEITRKIKKIKLEHSNKNENRRNLLKELRLPKEVDNIFYFFRRMGYWRDERKREAMIGVGYYYLFAQEFARRAGTPYKHVLFAVPEEIFSTRLNFGQSYKKELANRAKKSIYYCDRNNKTVVLTGRECVEFLKILEQQFNNQFKELKGQSASRGIIVGTVKVIKIPADFNKMKSGDILVAPMTRPEYLPLMKKAVAIITDEGGITCHAAIVARELGIPCVIGTQVATSILKDGDMVEVDANSGIIKVIKKV